MTKIDLFQTAKKIKRDIYLYPFLIIFLSVISLIFITYHSIENFRVSEKSELKAKLIEKEKELSVSQMKQVMHQIEFYQKKTIKTLHNNIKRRINEASDIINNIIIENPNKSKKEIKRLVSTALSPIRFFKGRGYYLVYDKDTKKSVIHPVKKFVGKDMSKFKDKKGQLIVQLFDQTIEKKGEGFTPDIYFIKPKGKDKKEYKKHIYVKYIPELNWVIGTGDYFDEVEKEVKKELLSELQNIRYGKNGYFWIMDSKYKLLMHPYREDELGNIQEFVQDSKGNYIGQMAVKIAINEPNEGFIKYHWVKPNQKNEIEKINFVKYFSTWDWIIGTGVYYEDIDKIVRSQEISYENKINNLYKNIFILFLILVIISLFISFILSKKIKKGFNSYSTELQNINESLEVKVKERTSELNKLNTELEDKIKKETEKNRFQEIQLLEQSKLAQMGEMIGNIAHQWRQPLSVISTIASGIKIKVELGSNKIEDNLNELDTIVNTTKHLSKTIDQFRDFIKTDKNRKEQVLQTIIKNAATLTEASLKHNNIKFINESNLVNDLIIETIDGELIQVLINIINNSKDALVLNSIENPWIKVTLKEEEKDISIQIEDNGKGIKKEIFHKIYNPYFTTKHQSQGTGIGLYMCKKIITKSLKGKLFAKNTQDGVIFTIKLPKS